MELLKATVLEIMTHDSDVCRIRASELTKRATKNSTFWYESSAASSVVTCGNMSANGRRPVARAKLKYDSPSDVVMNGDV